jgi:hypothetical protein
MKGIVVPETCWVSNKIWNKNHLLHPVGILFPHINRLTVYCIFLYSLRNPEDGREYDRNMLVIMNT